MHDCSLALALAQRGPRGRWRRNASKPRRLPQLSNARSTQNIAWRGATQLSFTTHSVTAGTVSHQKYLPCRFANVLRFRAVVHHIFRVKSQSEQIASVTLFLKSRLWTLFICLFQCVLNVFLSDTCGKRGIRAILH